MTRALWERARAVADASTEVELYARASRRVRVSIDPGGALRIDRGVDEGLAVRAFDPRRRTLGFAAASGLGAVEAARAARRAEADAVPYAGERPWSGLGGVRTDGADSLPELPLADDLADWLSGALRHSGCTPAEDPWVEASGTIEASWTRDGGWVRSRLRVWGILVAPCVAFPGAEPIPRVVAARDPAGLPRDPWPIVGGGAEGPAPRGSTRGDSVVFEGDSLAALVPALVRALTASGPGDRHRVGPGWVVYDDPAHADAPVGGLWDDAGFPTAAVRLADGQEIVGRIAGPGSFRRGSFRDPPEPAPTLLRVDPPAVAPPAGEIRILAARIHSFEDGWILEIDGAAPAPFRGRLLRTGPVELATRCVGGIGPAVLRAGAVLTPALRFEGLRVEG